jgi:hypothetical protein
MREIISIASMLLLLAFAGIEPSHAQITKTCKAGAVAEFFSTGC